MKLKIVRVLINTRLLKQGTILNNYTAIHFTQPYMITVRVNTGVHRKQAIQTFRYTTFKSVFRAFSHRHPSAAIDIDNFKKYITYEIYW